MADQSIILSRQHKHVSARAQQLGLNLLAARGGRRYVDRRLWRAPNESDLSWFGHRNDPKATVVDTGTVGRKDRAALVNDAGRVVSKITQYLFKERADRPGVDEEWERNVNGFGSGIDDFWVGLSETLTASQWLWVQVDRAAALKDEFGIARQRTLLEKTRDRDVVRWSIWPSTSVPDWHLGANGRLEWILTEDTRYDNADPMGKADEYAVRTLWRKVDSHVEITQYRLSSDGLEKKLDDTIILTDMAELPFVLVGTPSCEPWWFDDVETLQAQLLNLDSLHVESLVKTVFPQLVIARSSIESLEMRLVEQQGDSAGTKIMQLVRELVRGLDTPMVEGPEESGITRFIQPSNADQKTLPEEIQRKRQLLFDMVGLSLFNRETRQIQTAESKQFDQLDTESTLKHRAQVLQEAEERLVVMSQAVDPMFKPYAPAWPTSFDVVDVQSDAAALTLIANMPDVTPSMRKMVLLAAVRVLAALSGYDKELLSQAQDEIALLDFTSSGDGAAMDDTTGKIPLAIQQLALARERATKGGDTEMAAKLGLKIDELTAKI